MNTPNEYLKQINTIALKNIMAGAEKKADELYKELLHYCDQDKETFYVCRILIQELILELKINNGCKERIQYWLLVQNFLISKYKDK
jgi:hypothetical protein